MGRRSGRRHVAWRKLRGADRYSKCLSGDAGTWESDWLGHRCRLNCILIHFCLGSGCSDEEEEVFLNGAFPNALPSLTHFISNNPPCIFLQRQRTEICTKVLLTKRSVCSFLKSLVSKFKSNFSEKFIRQQQRLICTNLPNHFFKLFIFF